MKPTYSDEMQFLGWRDSSKSGPVVTFALPDRDALERFIGLEGKRFGAVLVHITDEPEPHKDPTPVGPIAQWLGQMCRNAMFIDWLASRYADENTEPDEDWAAEVVRSVCGVASRADIDKDTAARHRFDEQIRNQWIAFTKGGK